MDCSLTDSSVSGILQARILEWVAISFSRGSSQPRDRPGSLSPALIGKVFATSTTWEAQNESDAELRVLLLVEKPKDILQSCAAQGTVNSPAECIVRTVKMAVPLLSVRHQLEHLTDLLTALPQAQLMLVVIKEAVWACPSAGFPGN